jgi:hypothetical protein
VVQVIQFPSPPLNQPLSWCGLSVDPLFEALSPDNILSLFNYILLENQVGITESMLMIIRRAVVAHHTGWARFLVCCCRC